MSDSIAKQLKMARSSLYRVPVCMIRIISARLGYAIFVRTGVTVRIAHTR